MSAGFSAIALAGRVAEALDFVTSIFPKSRRDKMLVRLDATANGELVFTCTEAGTGHAVEASAVVSAAVSKPGAVMVLVARRLARFVGAVEADSVTFESDGAKALLVQMVREFEGKPAAVVASQGFPARAYLGQAPQPIADDDPVLTVRPGPLAHAVRYAHRAQGPDNDPYNWTFWLTTSGTASGLRAAACSGVLAAYGFAEEEWALDLEPFALSPGAVRGLLAMCSSGAALAIRDREDRTLWPWRQFTTLGAAGAILRLQCRKGTLFPEQHLHLLSPPKGVVSRVEVSGLAFHALVGAVTGGVKLKAAASILLEATPEEGLALSCTSLDDGLPRRSTVPCKVSAAFSGSLPLELLRRVFPAASRHDFKLELECFHNPARHTRPTLRITRADALDATLVRLGG